jgi:succinate-semialdehyde dehydrogenase/glutarate-semialdehyde dehydrogenase
VISPAAATRIEHAIADAVAAGARVAHRATVPDNLTGYFVAPTVLAGVPADATIVRDEIFGPVAPVVTFATDEEVVRLANDSEYGLAAYVYAGNLQRALRLGEAFDAGMVGVNRGVVSDPSAPFGGVKQSGLGREGAREGLLEYTEQQYLSIDWPEPR